MQVAFFGIACSISPNVMQNNQLLSHHCYVPQPWFPQACMVSQTDSSSYEDSSLIPAKESHVILIRWPCMAPLAMQWADTQAGNGWCMAAWDGIMKSFRDRCNRCAPSLSSPPHPPSTILLALQALCGCRKELSTRCRQSLLPPQDKYNR